MGICACTQFFLSKSFPFQLDIKTELVSTYMPMNYPYEVYPSIYL